MTFSDILKRFKGKRFNSRNLSIVPIKDTAYGAVIERFELDKYDIQITCYGSDQLSKLLEKITADVHD